MNPLLAVESIGKSFGKRRVLTTASMWAQSGKVTVLLGRNGCGKTTLVKIAIGLMKADYGVVIYHGQRMLRPRLHQLARDGLFYLPERNLLSPALTIGQHFRTVSRLVRDSNVVRRLVDRVPHPYRWPVVFLLPLDLAAECRRLLDD